MITELDNDSGIFMIKSFSDNHSLYEVNVIDQEMKTCSCEDFKWNKIACKHMYLLRRLHNKISIYKGKLINSNRSETIYSMQCLVPFNFFAPSLQRETQQPTAEENRPTTPASNG